MTDRMKAWQCAGCGRLDSDATSVGVCQDRRGDEWERSYKALQERARRLLTTT